MSFVIGCKCSTFSGTEKDLKRSYAASGGQ